MKCKYCDGTGTTNWCVNGTFLNCPHCGGTGEVDMTNEEWLKSMNTEQLAERIADKSNEIISWIICEVIKNECDVDEDDYWQKKSDVVEWLKQPHSEVGK